MQEKIQTTENYAIPFKEAILAYGAVLDVEKHPRSSLVTADTITEADLKAVAYLGSSNMSIEYSMMPQYKDGFQTKNTIFYSGSKDSTVPEYSEDTGFDSENFEKESYEKCSWTAHWHPQAPSPEYLHHFPSLSDYAVAGMYNHFSILFDTRGAIVYFPVKDFSDADVKKMYYDNFTYNDTLLTEGGVISAQEKYMKGEFSKKHDFVTVDVPWGSEYMQVLIGVMAGKIDEKDARVFFLDK